MKQLKRAESGQSRSEVVRNNNGVTVHDVPVTEYPRPCKTAVGSRNWLKLVFLESENCGAHHLLPT